MSHEQDHPDEEVMCLCSGTTCGQIRVMFRQGLDADAISRKTGALTGCGGCEWDLAAFINDLEKQIDQHTSSKPE